MADNVLLPITGTGTADVTVAADEIGGAKYQRMKLSLGADGTAADAGVGEGAATGALRVDLATDGTVIGTVTETAPGTDTASSGLNGRLQRIAQRLTSLIALLPAALGAGGGLKVDGSGTALPVDTELPAAAALADGASATPTTPTIGAILLAKAYNAETVLRAESAPLNTGAGAFGAESALLAISTIFANNGEGGVNPWFGNQHPSTGLLASAARTATTTSSDVTLGSSNSTMTLRGVMVFLNVTANPGAAETLSLKLQAKDNQAGTYVDLCDFGVVITAANGLKLAVAYPDGLLADYAAGAFGKNVRVPPYYRVVVTHSGAGSWTYSASVASLL